MAKGAHQKLKLLYLEKILQEETDEEHGLTMAQLTDRLRAQGISADRKTLYQDLEELEAFGLELLRRQQGGRYTYHLVSRRFELAELKLLVDSVQSAKFITQGKSQALIGKLESLVSRHQASQLHRQVIIAGRVKTMNESVYYSVDAIHAAISANIQIRFQYFNWNVRKEMELRHGGAWYQVSPLSLAWDDEYYYLIAWDSASAGIRHYRVDKMLHIQGVEARREGLDRLTAADLAGYSKRMFGMFQGALETVLLEGENRLAGVIIDRFGSGVMLVPQDGERFTVTVQVAVSDQFLGWVASLGGGVRILGPDHVRQEMARLVETLRGQYGPEDG